MTQANKYHTLVLRLHQSRMASHSFSTLHDLCEEAAEEIEQLEQELRYKQIDIETQSAEIERLRSELNSLN